MSDWQECAVLFTAAPVLSIVVYLVILLWPQRIPKDKSVNEIRRRIENETIEEPRSN